MANTTIITGQYVRINQTPASAGERILARLIDFVIIILYIYATSYFLRKSGFLSLFNDTSLVFFLLAVYLPVYGYSFLFETFNHGQSIGKRIMNIRVAMVDGSTPTLGSYLLRWLLFLVDFTITGGLGLIFILMTKNSQRIGDLAAGTMAYIDKLDNATTTCFIKSASYLMHTTYFSMIRDAILTHVSAIMQDDSGIPWRFYDQSKWDIQLYGSFSEPISMFEKYPQPDLRDAYQTSQPKPINFRIGYARQSNLQLSILKKQGEE